MALLNGGLKMNSGGRTIRIVVGIAILCLFLLAGTSGASPPPAILEIGGNEQIAGIGNNCWKVEKEKPMLCSDTFSINTPADPLLTRSPFTAHLSLPIQEPPDELGFSSIRVTDDDAIIEAANGFRAWRWGLQGMEIQVPLERESDINLSLPPGLYVFNVFAKWEGKGDVSYGFLVQVYEPEAKKNVGFEFVLAITALLLVITIRLKRR